MLLSPTRSASLLTLAAIVATVWGCDGVTGEGSGGIAVSDYLAVDVAEAWTWRDDGDTGVEFDNSTVLRARMDEEGLVEARRGPHWPDGEPVGSLDWDIESDDIVLDGWTWSEAAGSEDPTVLARSGGRDGDSADSGDGACVMARVEPFETTYGSFASALQCDCSASAAPDGSYWFAEGFGLVAAKTSAFQLNLVAPY